MALVIAWELCPDQLLLCKSVAINLLLVPRNISLLMNPPALQIKPPWQGWGQSTQLALSSPIPISWHKPVGCFLRPPGIPSQLFLMGSGFLYTKRPPHEDVDYDNSPLFHSISLLYAPPSPNYAKWFPEGKLEWEQGTCWLLENNDFPHQS